LAILPDKSKLFATWSLISQPIHRIATARLAVGTTFHHGNIVNLSELCI